MSWHRSLRLGAVYRPAGNRDYMYACVRLEERATFLLLISNTSAIGPGELFDEHPETFLEELRTKTVVRVA